MILQILVGLAVMAGLTWGLVMLWQYVREQPSRQDLDEARARLQQLTGTREIALVEAEAQRRMYEAALQARPQEPEPTSRTGA